MHKFQGREKEAIIYSSVIDAKASQLGGVSFIDDPKLLNVLVSRAKSKLRFITNPDLPKDAWYSHQLIDYIKRHSSNGYQQSEVVSLFDTLYKNYSSSLRKVAEKARSKKKRSSGRSQAAFVSEELIYGLLEEQLADENYRLLKLEYQVLLRDVVPRDWLSRSYRQLGPSSEELSFIKNGSSADFVLSNKVTGRVLGVVEVDGFQFHDNNPAQLDRDALKNSILTKLGIPLLRLSTVGSNERATVANFLESIVTT